jgi:hypothetical protein
MPQSAQNRIVMLHPEQETSQKRPYERMDGEPPRWFLRFTRYRLMGRDRSLQACVEQERQEEQAIDSSKKQQKQKHTPVSLLKPPGVEDVSLGADAPTLKVSVPGSWKRASAQWHWVERAEAWDIEQRQAWQERLTKEVLMEAEFASRAYRIWTLNAYADFLQKIILHTSEDGRILMKEKLAAIRLSQALMKDIRKEMDKLERSLPS